jgi:hypothetical protein
MVFDEPYIRYLKDEINKTGKPLEIKISSIIDKRWQNVSNQDTFYDREARKLREIDICASDPPKRLQNLELDANLIVECKRSEAFSWVFFTRPFNFEIEDIAGQYVDEVQMAAKNTERTEIMQMILGKTRLHYQNIERKAVTFDAFKTGDARKSQFREGQNEIHEAREQLKSYIDWAIEQDVKERIPLIPYTIEMYFPCIVFRGSMYEAVVENDDVKLNKARHLILTTLYKSPYSIYEKNLLIDVVSEEYFTDYQELIRENINNLEKTIDANSETISSRITEIVTLLESASKGR